MEFEDIRDRLVVAVLPHVLFDGWSRQALVAGARDLGLGDDMAERAFLGGPVEAIAHLVALGDRLMVADCAGSALEQMSLSGRIRALIRARLTRWAPYREAVRRALSVLSLPGHAAIAARISLGTVDALWKAAGDTPHDFSWYTKRASLGAIYAATLLVWLDDDSDDLAATWAFLDRRLADIGRLGKARAGVERMVGRMAKPLVGRAKSGRLMPTLPRLPRL